jgi:hypothetical protein
VVVPGELRWTRRPWFVRDGPSRRGPIAVFFAVIVVLAIAHAIF